MNAPFDSMALSVEPGPLVLEASAGTGKTFAIVQLAVRLLLGDTAVRSRGPRHLLLVTFTKAATAELQERLRSAIRAVEMIEQRRRPASAKEAWITTLLERLGDEAAPRIAEVVERIDELAVTTIHGFCVGVLEEFPQECGVRGELAFREDDTAMVGELLDDLLRAECWDDAWTAAGVVTAAWTREALLTVIHALRQHGDVGIEPTPDADAALHRFRAALAEAATRWDRDRVAARMNAAIWFETKQFGRAEVRTTVLDGLDALLQGDPSALGVLRLLEEKKLKDLLRKQKGDEKRLAEAVCDDPAIQGLQAAIARLDAWLADLRVSVAERVHAALPARKQADGIATFDDQIRLVRAALDDTASGGRLAEALHERFDAVLVDEAQDTDPAQWTIFKRAFARRPLVIVGDPKQAIYSWRGADLAAYIETRDAPGTQRAQLDRNWRSTTALLGALEALFTRAPQPFAVPSTQMDFISVAAAGTQVTLADPVSQAALRWMVAPDLARVEEVRDMIREAVVREITRLLGEVDRHGTRVQPRDIAILVRKHAEATAYREALRMAGINAVVSGAGDVTSSVAWQEVHALVEAISNPASRWAAKRAAATRLVGMPIETLAEWQRTSDTTSEQAWMTVLADAADLAERRGTFAALVGLLSTHDAVVRLAARPDGERWLTDLRHVLELVQEAEAELGSSPIRLAQWMIRWPVEAADVRERKQLRLESDADAVQVRTMHVAKGLQYPIVFVPTCWDTGKAPDGDPLVVRRGDAWHAVFRHADGYAVAQALAGAAEMQESLRLCYVALTRAESRVYVAVGCGASQTRRGALGWLLRPDGAAMDAKAKDEWPDTRAAVDALIAASDGSMDAVPVDGAISHTPMPPTHDPQSLVARIDPPRPLRTWRVTSYTQLTAHREADADVADPATPVDRSPRTDLDLLPAGATSGVALHRLFEVLDFDATDATIATVSTDTLAQFGLLGALNPGARPRVVAATAAMAAATLRAPVSGWGFALANVPRGRTLREWNFNLTIDRADLGRVADALHTTGGASASYADRIAQLARGSLDGFLTGVVDLIFEHEGKWYLVDWKSNHLGHDPASYDPSALAAEMERHHYVLQYQLYLVALDRFLRSRLPGWDPATMLGGVGYAFVRGGAWYVDAPSAAVIAAVGAAL